MPEYRDITDFSFWLMLSTLLLVRFMKLQLAFFRPSTHSWRMLCQLLLKYSTTLCGAVLSSSYSLLYSSLFLAYTIFNRISKHILLSPCDIPSFSVDTSLRIVRRVWNKQIRSFDCGNCSDNTFLSVMSLSDIIHWVKFQLELCFLNSWTSSVIVSLSSNWVSHRHTISLSPFPSTIIRTYNGIFRSFNL